MLSEPRTISLLTEFIHLPVAHQPEKLREVYNHVCKSCGYENFLRVPGGARIERREAESEGFSQLTFLNDRVQLTEDHTGVSSEQFGKKVMEVLKTALPTLGIPIILIQQATVRITSAPNSFRTAAEYLARSVFRVRSEDVELLGRPTTMFGFRLMFPPTHEQPQKYSVRVECYVRDGRSLYIENVGTFNAPIQQGNLEQAEKNLHMTGDFLVDKVVKFLSAHDRREAE